MIDVEIQDSEHKFEKTNLITIMSRKGGYDELKCTVCGFKARSFTLGYIRLHKNQVEKGLDCKKVSPTRQIQITQCNAQGKAFANLTPGSIHEIVPPPKPHKNDEKGHWVQGVGEPVKVLRGEYKYISHD